MFYSVTFSVWDFVLIGIVLYLVYRLWYKRHGEKPNSRPVATKLPPLKRQDFTLEQLRAYDGAQSNRHILLAVDGKVFDVSTASHLYGRDGPYGIFAGRDASRGLALMQIDDSVIKESYDDLSDLTSSDMENMREWSTQFKEKYPVVGRLLKPGEEPDFYSDEDDGAGPSDTGTDSPSKKQM